MNELWIKSVILWSLLTIVFYVVLWLFNYCVNNVVKKQAVLNVFMNPIIALSKVIIRLIRALHIAYYYDYLLYLNYN